jgi:hypothetical protein
MAVSATPRGQKLPQRHALMQKCCTVSQFREKPLLAHLRRIDDVKRA